MKPERTDIHPVRLHLLSPVHIGTGEELDPFSYVIRDNFLHFVDTGRWAAETPEATLLEKTVSAAGFAAVRSLIARNIDVARYSIGRIEVRSKNLLDTYRYSIERQDARNQVLVSPLPRGAADRRAYIPGSSLKGAVRTALANAFVQAAGVKSEDARGRPDYNQKIFGTIRQDPLRHLKFRDIPLPQDATVIFEAREFSMKPDKRSTPKGYFEAAAGGIDTGKSIIYETTISLSPFALHGKMVDRAFLIESLNAFYKPKFFEEREKFYARQHGQAVYKATAPLAKSLETMKPHEALVRLGHFSHVECVTLDGVRRPVTRYVKSRQLPWGTTRTLAEGLYPFGWVILDFD
jgi:CRISPR type III-A-associated RAMP protein Csm5